MLLLLVAKLPSVTKIARADFPLGKFSYQKQMGCALPHSPTLCLGEVGLRLSVTLSPTTAAWNLVFLARACPTRFGNMKRLLFPKIDIEVANNWPEFSNNKGFHDMSRSV